MADFKTTTVTDPRAATENQAVIDAVKDLAEVEILTLDDGDHAHVMAVPKGKELVSVKPFLNEYRTAPERKRGTARLTTLASFCAHVKRFADANSVLFANVDVAEDDDIGPHLVAVLDYHEAGSGAPRFGDHRAAYPFPLSEEWTAWTQTRPMGQRGFAEFIEDHIADVLDPKQAGDGTWAFVEALEITLAAPTAVLALAKGIAINVEARVKNAVNLSSGEAQLQFETEHRDATGAPIKVPRAFLVGIPVFTGGERYPLPIRLRYRVKDGAVTWELVPYRVEQAFRDAVTKACDVAAKETGLPLFYGTPES